MCYAGVYLPVKPFELLITSFIRSFIHFTELTAKAGFHSLRSFFPFQQRRFESSLTQLSHWKGTFLIDTFHAIDLSFWGFWNLEWLLLAYQRVLKSNTMFLITTKHRKITFKRNVGIYINVNRFKMQKQMMYLYSTFYPFQFESSSFAVVPFFPWSWCFFFRTCKHKHRTHTHSYS